MMLLDQNPELGVYIATLFISFYYTLIKKFPKHLMILYFWLHILCYGAFALLIFFQEDAVPSAIKQLAFDTSYANFPLYTLSSVALIATYIILEKLIRAYPIPMVLALSQISIILSTVGYIALGDRVTTISLIGLFILFLGAMISGLQNFSFNDPLKSFKGYDKELLKFSLYKAILYSATLLITFLCTARYSDITKHILQTLTKHLHYIPFIAIAPIHFNVGVQFTNFVLMFLFITFVLKEKALINSIMKKQYPIILSLAACYILNTYFYYYAFDLIEDKNYITAISKLYLPLTLILCYWAYQEKPSKEQIVGMAIIILGSFITTLG